MSASNIATSELEGTIEQMAIDVRNRHRSHLHNLRIELLESGIVLHGRAASFYGKQMAFQEVIRRSSFPVLANRIEVVG